MPSPGRSTPSCSRRTATRLESSCRGSGRDAEGCRSRKAGAPLPLLGNWNEQRSPNDDDLVQRNLVAGARNHHYLQLWRLAA